MENKVLITGVAGFLGINLLNALLNRNYLVVGIDNLSHGSKDALPKKKAGQFHFVEGDVRDYKLIAEAAKGARFVIHLADMKIPRYGNSLGTLDVNVLGTESALNAAVQEGAQFILGSTDEVYGKNSNESLNEESSLILGQPNVNRWSLGASKMMAEQICFAYSEKFGLPITIIRYFGGYGPYQSIDWRGGPQSVFITAAIRREKIPIHGDGLQTRTLTSIHDLVAGTILAMESPIAHGEIFNIASRENISIINLAYLIWRLCKVPKKPQFKFVPYTDFSRNYEDVRSRVADISKAHYLLGYEPKVTLNEGLEEAIDWQRNNSEK